MESTYISKEQQKHFTVFIDLSVFDTLIYVIRLC
jgi:hypothetical protein